MNDWPEGESRWEFLKAGLVLVLWMVFFYVAYLFVWAAS